MYVINTDATTGIRYGVISMHSLDLDFVSDHLMPGAPHVTCIWAPEDRVLTKKQARRIWAWRCRRVLAQMCPWKYTRRQRKNAADAARYINAIYAKAELRDTAEPVGWYYKHEGVWLQSSFAGTCFTVSNSPVVVRCRECSPCVPHAGNLDRLDPEGVDTYGLPLEWLTQEAAADMQACLDLMREVE